MIRHYITAFRGEQYPQAMVMIDSLNEHCTPCRITVLCLDFWAYQLCAQTVHATEMNILSVSTMVTASPFHAALVRRGFQTGDGRRQLHSTFRPILCDLAINFSQSKQIVYVDPDVVFYAPFENIADSAGNFRFVGMTPYRFSRNAGEQAGKHGSHNPAIMWFRKSEVAREAIRAWATASSNAGQDSCDYRAWHNTLGRMFVEFPQHTLVCPHQMPKITGSPLELDGKVITAYHFAGFRRLDTGMTSNAVSAGDVRYSMGRYAVHDTTKKSLYKPYAKRVLEKTPDKFLKMLSAKIEEEEFA